MTTEEKNFKIDLPNSTSIFLPYEIKKYILTTRYIYFTTNDFYSYNLESKEIKCLLKKCTVFDVHKNKVVVGDFEGKIFYFDKDITIKYHFHDDPVKCLKFSKTGNVIYSSGTKDMFHVYDLNTNESKIIKVKAEIEEILVNDFYIETRNSVFSAFYDSKLEKVNFKINKLNEYVILDSVKETKKLREKRRYHHIKTKGIFQENNTKEIHEKIFFKTREMIFNTQNYLVIYNFKKNEYTNIAEKAEKIYVNNFIILKNKNRVKIFDYKFNQIFEKEIFDENYKNIIFIKNKLFFHINDIILEERFTNRKIIYKEIIGLIYYMKDVCVILRYGIKKIKENDCFINFDNIQKYKVINDFLLIYNGKVLLIYKEMDLIFSLEKENLIDFTYEEGKLIYLLKNENKISLSVDEKEIEVPNNTICVLSLKNVLLKSGEVLQIE